MAEEFIVAKFGNAEIKIPLSDAYVKDYKIRKSGKTPSSSPETTLPLIIVQRAARKYNIPYEQVFEKLKAQLIFDQFDGVMIRIVPKENLTLEKMTSLPSVRAVKTGHGPSPRKQAQGEGPK